MIHVGVPILLQREFRSNVVVVYTGKLGALQGTRAIRGAFTRFSPEEVTVDDSDAAHPVYFFDTHSDRTVTDAGYTLVLTFFGVDGPSHPSLPVLLARGHEYLFVTDLAGDEAKRAAELFAQKLPGAKRSQVHLLSTTSDAQSASLALKQIQEDIVAKAGR